MVECLIHGSFKPMVVANKQKLGRWAKYDHVSKMLLQQRIHVDRLRQPKCQDSGIALRNEFDSFINYLPNDFLGKRFKLQHSSSFYVHLE
jgi:hypothetical protein